MIKPPLPPRERGRGEGAMLKGVGEVVRRVMFVILKNILLGPRPL